MKEITPHSDQTPLAEGGQPALADSAPDGSRRDGDGVSGGLDRQPLGRLLRFGQGDEQRGTDWTWCFLDSASVKAPKGGDSRVPTLQIVENLARRPRPHRRTRGPSRYRTDRRQHPRQMASAKRSMPFPFGRHAVRGAR